MIVACYHPLPLSACMLNFDLISILFGTSIPISFNILVKIFYTCRKISPLRQLGRLAPTCPIKHHTYMHIPLMYIFLLVSPQPLLEYYNHTIEKLNQPVLLNCSVSAVPRPEFQWILADTEEPLPESSWNSTTYVDKTTTSTLNYTFEMSDLNDNSKIHVMCIAKNPYGKSEQHYTLSLNSLEISVTVSSSPDWSVPVTPTPLIKSTHVNWKLIISLSIVGITILFVWICAFVGFWLYRKRT